MREIIRKFKRHYQRWKIWKGDTPLNLFAIQVLLGLRKSILMDYVLLPDERPTQFFYENDRFCECGEVKHGGEK